MRTVESKNVEVSTVTQPAAPQYAQEGKTG